MNSPFNFGDIVTNVSEAYSCAEKGSTGVIVDDGYITQFGLWRFLVRWDYAPDMFFGVHHLDIIK